MRVKRRALENAGALLGDEDVVGLDGKFAIDGIAVHRHVGLAPGRNRARRPIVGARLLGAEENRNAGAARRSEEFFGRRDGAVSENSAGVDVAVVDFGRRQRSAAVDQIVEIDREQRRPRSDKRLAPPAGIKLQVAFRNDVLPAVVVEVVDRCHGMSPRPVRVPLSSIATWIEMSHLRTYRQAGFG